VVAGKFWLEGLLAGEFWWGNFGGRILAGEFWRGNFSGGIFGEEF